MKTRDKILAVSKKVFQREGIRNTTTRMIANEMNISPGNLHYHFKHSEDIIKALFDELVVAFDNLLFKLDELDVVGPIELNELLLGIHDIVEDYKFLFINFAEITKWIPEIHSRYQLIQERRGRQTFTLFKRMYEKGILKHKLSDSEIRTLVRNIMIITDYWPSFSFLTKDSYIETSSELYLKSINSLVIPLFNEQFLMEYNENNNCKDENK